MRRCLVAIGAPTNFSSLHALQACSKIACAHLLLSAGVDAYELERTIGETKVEALRNEEHLTSFDLFNRLWNIWVTIRQRSRDDRNILASNRAFRRMILA